MANISHASYTYICQLILPVATDKATNPSKLHIRTYADNFESRKQLQAALTYSRYLVHVGGSDMAMKKQLVRIVNIMNKLNNVKRELRNVYCKVTIYSYLIKYVFLISRRCIQIKQQRFIVILWSIYTRMNGHCLYLQTTVNADYKKQCKQILFNIDSVEKHNLPYGDMDWNPKGSTESLQMIAKIKVL